MSHRLFTPEQEREIVRRYEARESTVAIGKTVIPDRVVRPNTINNTLRRLGVRLRTELAERTVTPEEEDRMLALCMDEGKSREDAGAEFGVSKETVRRIVRERGVRLRQGRPPECEVNHAAFDELTPTAAYWLGFIFADGWVAEDAYGSPAVALALAEKDRGHVEKFRAFLGSTHAISTVLPGKGTFGGICAAFKVRSKRLCEALWERGMEKKAERVPIAELRESIDFWRGAVDGDGWLGVSEHAATGHRFAFAGLCGHLPLLDLFRAFLASHGIRTNGPDPTTSGIWKVQASERGAEHIIECMYRDPVEALTRKNIRAQAIIAGDLAKSVPYAEDPSCIRLDDATMMGLPEDDA